MGAEMAAGAESGAEMAAGAAEPEPEEEHEGWSLEGYLSLYQGIDGALVKEGPPSALYLGIYEVMKSYLLTTTSWPLLAIYLTAGTGARPPPCRRSTAMPQPHTANHT